MSVQNRIPLTNLVNYNQQAYQTITSSSTKTTNDSVIIRKVQSIQPNASDQLGNELKMRMWKVDHLQQELTQISESFENCVVTLDELRQQNLDLTNQNQRLVLNNNELQNNVVLLTTEIERMNSLLRQKVPEMEEYKQRSIHFESQTRQTTIQITEYQNQLLQVTKEMERLNQIIHQKLYELEDSQTKIKQYQFQIKNTEQTNKTLSNQNEELKDNLYHYEKNIQEQDNRTHLLVQEVERLNKVLEDQRKNSSLENNQLQKFEVEYKKIYSSLESKSSELEECKNYLLRKESELHQYRLQDDNIMELQNKTVLLTNEIERLNQILQEKKNTIEELRFKYSQSEQQGNEQQQRLLKVDHLQIQLREISESFENCVLTLDEQRRQNSDLSQLNQKLMQSNNDTQNNLVMLTNEIERLNSMLRQKVPELEDYKQRSFHFEQQNRQTILQITEYQNKLQQATREMERLNQIIHQKLYEVEDCQAKLVTFQTQSKSFEQTTKQKSSEIEEWVSKYRRLEGTFQEYRGIEEKLSHHQQRIVMLCAEIERLGLVHIQMAQECTQMHQQSEQFQFNLRTKDESIYKINERNNLLQKLVDEEKNKRLNQEQDLFTFKAFQDKCVGYEQRVVVQSQEIDRLSVMYNQKSQETDEMKQRYDSQSTTFSQKLREYENKVVFTLSENERINNIIFQVKKENEEITSRFSQMEQRYHYSSQSCEDYKLKLTQIEVSLGQTNNLKNKVIELEHKIIVLTSDIERVVSQRNQEGDTNRITIYSLEEKIIKFKSYEENVRILSIEIDRLNYIVEQQEQELRVWRLQYADGGQQVKKIQDLQTTLVMSFVEIESLRARVYEKEKEVEDVRRSSLAPYRR